MAHTPVNAAGYPSASPPKANNQRINELVGPQRLMIQDKIASGITFRTGNEFMDGLVSSAWKVGRSGLVWSGVRGDCHLYWQTMAVTINLTRIHKCLLSLHSLRGWPYDWCPAENGAQVVGSPPLVPPHGTRWLLIACDAILFRLLNSFRQPVVRIDHSPLVPANGSLDVALLPKLVNSLR